MTTRKITILLLLLALLVLGAWDFYAAINAQNGDTISEIVLAASFRSPIIPFLAGIVCGHLFWPQERS